MRTIKVTLVFLFLYSLAVVPVFAQTPDKLEYVAKTLEGGRKDGVNYKKLIGNVKFTQKTTIIYCDSALAYDKKNSMEAFGHVRIEDLEDSVTITSNKLYYDGNGKVAELRGNVVYVDDSIQLYTDNLDYDMTNKSATYFKGGKIIDGINVLESIHGNYDTEGKMMIFKDSVKMTTPDYVLESNDLIYNLITKKAKIQGESKITTNDGKVLIAEQGSEFDTQKSTSAFLIGEVDTEKYNLKGDELYFDSQLGSYSAKGNVYVLSKEDKIVITGEQANFWQDKGIAKVYGDPLLKKPLGEDTLYLRADTLVSINDSLEANKRLLAYKNVKIYKSDLQGTSDSLAYFLSDSSMAFYEDPILWNDGSQITADTIDIYVKNGTIDQLITSNNSFIISQDSTSNFNQIKGRSMKAYFINKNIDNVDVLGNGESIYFIADEENTKTIIGMNSIVCSNMNILFAENQVDDIRFFGNPVGKIIPPHELKEEDKTLEGFDWRIDERPTKNQLLLRPNDQETTIQVVKEPTTTETAQEQEKLKQLMEKKLKNKSQRPPQKRLQN